MEKIELRTAPREILGKKVRFLRHQGITPVHLFGHGVEPMALQCDTTQLQRVLTQAGKTRLVNLKLKKKRTPQNVVVREVQKDPLTGMLLHVDFYQVSMVEKIKVEVPIILLGEPPGLKAKDNVLDQELRKLTIECLPDEIPNSIEIDLNSLTEADQAIQVKNIVLGEGITILDNPEQIVVKISKQYVEAVEEVVAKEEVKAEEVEAPEAAAAPEEKAKEAKKE